MTTQARFPAASRVLHWMMAPMIVAMLFIGVGIALRSPHATTFWSRSIGRSESPSLRCA